MDRMTDLMSCGVLGDKLALQSPLEGIKDPLLDPDEWQRRLDPMRELRETQELMDPMRELREMWA